MQGDVSLYWLKNISGRERLPLRFHAGTRDSRVQYDRRNTRKGADSGEGIKLTEFAWMVCDRTLRAGFQWGNRGKGAIPSRENRGCLFSRQNELRSAASPNTTTQGRREKGFQDVKQTDATR